jgi:hypothetical protein
MVKEGSIDAELQQQLQKAYMCEKSGRHMMETMNDDRAKTNLDE